MIGGILGLFLLIADIWAFVDIGQKASAPVVKVIWTVVILLLPFFGLALWFLAGPRGAVGDERAISD